MKDRFSKLNDMQREAVNTTEGPVLILAGAGSGKTTVLVNRIANIIDNCLAKPYEILAITFTNKAANELKSRIIDMLGETAEGIWASTFHSACIRILRKFIDYSGYDRAFNIFDRADQLTVVKDCIKTLGINDTNFPPKMVLSVIGRAKDELISPEQFVEEHSDDFRMRKIGEIYTLYQKRLKECNSLDFDDIIFETVRLLKNNPDVLSYYQQKFKYICVDEYQDTNHAQYVLSTLLADGYKNICVVGDDDQSIYKFRGADITNILNFEHEYPNAKVVKLEQNYRSTQNILDAANNVIINNKGRTGKRLWTGAGAGDKIFTYQSKNEHEEGRFIADMIDKLHKNENIDYKDIALLYRTNAQSRVLEEMLIRSAIPYKVLAGTRFYDRKEIKDIIAYLRTIYNPNDDVSLTRIINEPKRAIGAATVEAVAGLAARDGVSMFYIISSAEAYPELKKAAEKLSRFADLIEALRSEADKKTVSDFVKTTMEQTGYVAMLQNEKTVESRSRLENLDELYAVAQEYEKNDEEPSFGGFLESIALYSDIDGMDEDIDNVILMTMHSAKGLEFPVVFLPGLEEGLFPGVSAIEDDEDMEEERRLCYVAITRAKQKLYITYTDCRNRFGKTVYNRPSRFIGEIPSELIDCLSVKVNKPTHESFEEFINRTAETKPNYGMSVTLSATPKKFGSDFNAGDRVSHKKFGLGTVIKAVPVGADLRLEIAFDSVGTKILMAAYANLKKEG